MAHRIERQARGTPAGGKETSDASGPMRSPTPLPRCSETTSEANGVGARQFHEARSHIGVHNNIVVTTRWRCGHAAELPLTTSRASLTASPGRWGRRGGNGRLRLVHGWWMPLAGEYFTFRGVKPHGQPKGCQRRGQPVRLALRARVGVLQVEIQRPVRVVRQWITVADSEAVELVGDLEPVGVIHRHRPKRGDRWQLVGVEMEDVVVFPDGRVPVGVG